MTELRFIEREDQGGWILQSRDAPYAPWKDVPLVTWAQQVASNQEAAADAQDIANHDD